VTGTIKTVIIEGSPEQVFRNPVGTPVDESGNAVTSDSEFSLLDASLFGTDRSNPITTLTVPDDQASSFINSEEDVIAALVPSLIGPLKLGGNFLANLTVVTLVFTDKTSAEYIKVQSGSSYNWMWDGKAWDKNGHPMNRDGTLKPNPNTAGNGGGSSQSSTGSANFGTQGGNLCQTETTVTLGGFILSYNFHYLPC
jgi:hypothetical protein